MRMLDNYRDALDGCRDVVGFGCGCLLIPFFIVLAIFGLALLFGEEVSVAGRVAGLFLAAVGLIMLMLPRRRD